MFNNNDVSDCAINDNTKKRNTRQTNDKSNTKTTTTKPQKAPEAPKTAPHADIPPRAPLPNDTFRPEPPRRETRKSSCGDEQCPYLFMELVERFNLWQHRLGRGKDKLTQKDMGEIAIGLEDLVRSVNFVARVYVGGKFLLVPPPDIDVCLGNVGDITLFSACKVILAGIDAALDELANLVGVANMGFSEDDVPF